MPQNIIQGVKVDGVIYKYDYESLENLPGPELPEYSESADDGKVLSVSDGSGLVWSHPGAKLPQYANSDEGNVLTVGSNGNYLYWENPDPFPEYDSSDQGKLLAVANEGLEWTDSLLPEYSHNDMGKLLAVANTGVEWIDPPIEVPQFDNGVSGNVLMVNDTGNDIEWRSPFPDHAGQTNAYLQLNDNGEVVWESSPLPNYNSSLSGSYLRVDDNGDLEWTSQSGTLPNASQCTGGEALVVGGTGDDGFVWRKLLPDFSDQDHGKALVVGGSDDPSGLMLEQILPSWSGSDDAGKVLTIDANGHLNWQMP